MPAVRAANALAPTARSRNPSVERVSSHQQRQRREQREQQAGVDPQVVAEQVRQPGVAVDRCATAAWLVFGRLEALDRQQVGEQVERDVVEHDRRDDLVRAGARLEQAGDAAPDRAADDAGRRGRRRRG